MSGEEERKALVDLLCRTGMIKTERVRRAFLKVPREEFVLPEHRPYAYFDDALPLFSGQTISQPSVVAFMTEALQVENGQKILEVGAGSGYQAALLAELDPDGIVYTVERIPELAEYARRNLERTGYRNVRVVVGDGSLGLPEHAPFDRIIVTAAAPEVPRALGEQLSEGGIMVIPVGPRHSQRMVRVSKKGGRLTEEDLGFPVVFVPLVGEQGFRA